MDNKKRKLENGLKETKFQLNENTVVWKINQQEVRERSTLLNGLFENCNVQNTQTIKLTLEKPKNFFTLLEFLETGKIPIELKHLCSITSFVNDIVYLGIDELESHAVDVFKKAITEKKCDELDFSESRTNFDFIERVIRETQDQCSFERCKLLMGWLGKNDIDRKQIQAITQFIQFDNLTVQQVKNLATKFPEPFDIVFKPSVIYSIMCKFECTFCKFITYRKLSQCPLCHEWRTLQIIDQSKETS